MTYYMSQQASVNLRRLVEFQTAARAETDRQYSKCNWTIVMVDLQPSAQG